MRQERPFGANRAAFFLVAYVRSRDAAAARSPCGIDDAARPGSYRRAVFLASSGSGSPLKQRCTRVRDDVELRRLAQPRCSPVHRIAAARAPRGNSLFHQCQNFRRRGIGRA